MCRVVSKKLKQEILCRVESKKCKYEILCSKKLKNLCSWISPATLTVKLYRTGYPSGLLLASKKYILSLK